MTPTGAYLDELARLLRRRSRRRILAEVDAHLIEAVAAACARGAEPASAEREAIARFGEPADVARQFNALRRPRLRSRRSLIVALTCATASVGSAGAWAIAPGSATGHPVAHHAPHLGARHHR